MARNREAFLSRWSRRKRETVPAAPERTQATPLASAETPARELPPIDSLTPESDFSGFMHKQVDDKLRRAALRKLFADPSFNLVDGLDDYAEDFTLLETLAEGAAAGLEHSKSTLLGPDWDKPVQDPVAGDTIDADAEAATAEAEAEDAVAPSTDEESAAAAIAETQPAPADPNPDAVTPRADATQAVKPSDAAKR